MLCRYTGSALFTRLSQSFGYLNKQGYCSRSNSNNCHRFPVVIGETGTNFALQADTQQMADFALYLNNQGQGNDGQHNAIGSWFWWAWNANSGMLLTKLLSAFLPRCQYFSPMHVKYSWYFSCPHQSVSVLLHINHVL